jgi:hypothetical protein
MYLDFSTLLALLALILIAAIAWFWSDSLRARENMTAACARICQDMQLQFLDETVALARLRLARGPDGNLAWRRLYVFDFSKSGDDRWKGRAQLVGRRVESIHLENPQGITILSDVRPASSALITKHGEDPDIGHPHTH